jgi:hypothetical protein
MQANGAEMLREAAVRLCEAGIVPIMLIHDGILFEEAGSEKIAEAAEIMRAALSARGSKSASISTSGSNMGRATATNDRWRKRCGRPSWTSCTQSAPCH